MMNPLADREIPGGISFVRVLLNQILARIKGVLFFIVYFGKH
jgi:hypothetical protein